MSDTPQSDAQLASLLATKGVAAYLIIEEIRTTWVNGSICAHDFDEYESTTSWTYGFDFWDGSKLTVNAMGQLSVKESAQ